MRFTGAEASVGHLRQNLDVDSRRGGLSVPVPTVFLTPLPSISAG